MNILLRRLNVTWQRVSLRFILLPLLAGLTLSVGLFGCQQATLERFQGYAEGEPVRVAAQQSGVLTSLAVQRGDTVQTGTALFSLEQAQEAAAVAQSQALLAQAQAQAANLGTGKRAPEIAVIDAQIADARARAQLSRDQLAASGRSVCCACTAPGRMPKPNSAAAIAPRIVTIFRLEFTSPSRD